LRLARELIGRGWLTPFQVNHLFLDKGDELLLGSYVLLERLGEGGMGQVFKARNWKLDRIVALKLIRKDRLASSASAVRRFEREIRVAAQLEHPNIIRAIDADMVGGVYLFAMELVPGVDLAQHVRARGPLPVASACDYIRQAALGLGHALEKELVHRDIKPSNLLLTTPGEVVKVLDLGLARSSDAANDEGSTSLTEEGLVMGTPDYLAPEQALDARAADIRSDLYSLGCTFYFLLTGSAPFPGGSTLEKLIRHREQEPTPIEELRPDVSPAVAAVLRGMMAKRPADRFQTPTELIAALAQATAGVAVESPRTHIGVGLPGPEVQWSAIVNTPTSDSREHSWLGRLRRPRHGWVPLLGAAVATAAAVLILVAGSVWYGGKGEQVKEDEQPIIPKRTGSADPPRQASPVRLAAFDVSLNLRAALPAHKGEVTALVAGPGGQQLISAGPDPEQRIRVWDATDRKSPRLFTQPSDAPLAVVVSHDGRTVAAAGRGGVIHVWDAATGKQRESVAVNTAEVRGLALSPDGVQLYWADEAGEDHRRVLRMRDLGTGREPPVTEVDRGPLLALAGTHDGRYLVTTSAAGKLRLFETGWRRERWTASFDGPCSRVALGPNGEVVAAAGRLNVTGSPGLVVRLWGTQKGEPRGTLPVHAPVTTMAFSADGSGLAVGCADGTVRLWDWDGQRLLKLLHAHPGPVRAVAFTADGKILATGGDDGILNLWDIETAAPSADTLAATRIVNNLGMTLHLVPAGEFTMGTGAQPPHGPEHPVRILRPYYLGAHEVTVGQFRAFARATGRAVERLPDGQMWEKPGWEQSDDYPVVGISHADAEAFCRWLSDRDGRSYRLPTEAEWERAAQANLAASDAALALKSAANHQSAGLGQPLPVGYYAAGALGLCDLAGNVAEWCGDWYEADYYRDSPRDDPAGPPRPKTEPRHVTRGGSFAVEPGACIPSHRQARAGPHLSVGFRVLMEPRAEDLVPWQPLWAGDRLDGWEVKNGRAEDWSLTNGRLQCKPGPKGWLGTRQRYADFVLRLEWRIPTKGDSGVLLRVPADTGNPAVTGFEAQIIDDASVPKASPQTLCGGIPSMAGPSRSMSRGPGEWNTYEIACRGQRFTVTLNGTQTVAVDGNERWEALARARAGMIGLQHWGTQAEFRNACIKVLTESPPAPTLPRLRPVAAWSDHTGPVWRLALTADGKIVGSASDDRTAILWDRATGKRLHTLSHKHPVTAIALSADGSLVATGGKDAIHLWNGETGNKIKSLAGHKGSLAILAISPHGTMLASGGGEAGTKGTHDWCIRLWDLPTGQLRKRLTAPGLALVSRLDFAPEGRYLASGGWNNPVYLWDPIGDAPPEQLVGHNGGARGVAVAPGGARLASVAHDGTVRLWDRATRTEKMNVRLEAGPLSCVRFSPNGKVLAVGDQAGVIHLLDAATGNRLAQLIGHDGNVPDLAFTGDGSTLVSCGEDTTVRLWDVAAYCRDGADPR
jgi:WD40 repeat protein/serine/threonine protein kinase